MNNEILYGIIAYLYILGGFAIVAVLNPKKKLLIFLLWPIMPFKAFLSIFFSSQKEFDRLAGEDKHD